MNPKFACADFTFPLLAHDQVLQLVAMLEFEGLDIGLFEERSHLWPSQEFENLDDSAKQLKQKLTDQGLQAAIDWEHCNECDNLSETIQFRDHFRSLVGS